MHCPDLVGSVPRGTTLTTSSILKASLLPPISYFRPPEVKQVGQWTEENATGGLPTTIQEQPQDGLESCTSLGPQLVTAPSSS